MLIAIAGCLWALALPALADPPLVRADIPLWTEVDENVWPRQFRDADSVGCASRLKAGIWKRTARDQDDAWQLLRNSGLFHCHLSVDGPVDDPTDLGLDDGEIGLLISLGTTKGPDADLELYALQVGFLGGSTYTHLATRHDNNLLEDFLILDVDCPDEWMREARGLTAYLTAYCAVPDRAGVERLARKAAARPAVGRIAYDRPSID